MQPGLILEYDTHREQRPRWMTRLGVVSLVLGTIGVVAGAMRWTDARMYVFDPTFRWYVPPPTGVPTLYFCAVTAAVAVSLLLMTAGVVSLVKPRVAIRLHLIYAAIKLPLVVLTAWLRMLLIWRVAASAWTVAIEGLVECVVFGIYPTIVPFVVLRKMRSMQQRKVADV